MKISFTIYEKHNDESIAELRLPESLEGLLRRNNVILIGDLIDRIEHCTLEDIKNMGDAKIKTIKNALFNYELCVAPDPIEFILKCKKIA